MWMLNGVETNTISVMDRGLMLGDGCFTTLQIRDSALQLWPYHWQRLVECCQRLQLLLPAQDVLVSHLKTMATGHHLACAKVVLTRGSGGRGYSSHGCNQQSELLTIQPFPEHYLQWRQQGVKLGVCQQRLGSSSMLAGLKTLNRLEQVLLKDEIERSGWPEAIVLNEGGYVIEGVTANLFWRRDCVLYTPDLSRCGVRGVMRAWVMEQMAALGLRIEVVAEPLSSMMKADEVFITNALMEVVPVTGINDAEYPDHALARQLQGLLATSPVT